MAHVQLSWIEQKAAAALFAAPPTATFEEAHGHFAAAEAMDEGAVAILPERSLPVDIFSECARAQAQLGEAARAARHRQRLQLRERFALLNECIEQPRHQLSLV